MSDRRRNHRRLAAAITLVAALAALAAGAAPRPAAAADASEVADIAFDVAVLRPLNATAVVLGAVFFVVAVPFAAPFDGLEPAWDTFVAAPYEYTVERDLGEF